MEKKAQDESSKETLKSQESSRRISLNRNNSKEKICNDQQKLKNTSKLPRIVRMPTKYYKPIVNPNKSSDDSGDSLPGPSKLEGAPTKREDIIPEKLKLSHIPRLKYHKDGLKENNEPANRSQLSNSTYNQYIPECRNVQRVNLLINPEFCPDDLAPPVSVQSTRPIPTLGQIYGRINMIDSDRLNDWFTALGTPMASIPSSNGGTTNSSAPNEFFISGSSSAGMPMHCHQEELQRRSTVVMETQNNLSKEIKPTSENVGGWQMLPDGEFPTRDTESASAYKTMSLKNVQKSNTVTPKKSQQSQVEEGQTLTMNTNQTYCVGLSIENPKKSSVPKLGVECYTDTSSLLRQQPTVVLCGTPETHKVEEGTFTSKSYVSLKPSRLSKTKDANNNTGSSNVQQHAITQVPRVPVLSYTDCFSEVLQKTTNFEIIEGIASNKSPSSDDVTDADMRENTSVIQTKDENEMCDGDDSTTLESYDTKQSKSSDNTTTTTTTFLRSDATGTEWSCKYRSDNSSDYPSPDSCTFRHELGRRYYDDSRNNELRERCKKCQRFKRFPSSRYKLPSSFASWRRGGSIRRLCCLRWNHVWKKTAERWATWSSKSHVKSRRFRNVQNLVRSGLWEDVDVQTTMVLFNEAGTTAINERKSAAISTMFNVGACQAITNQTDIGIGFKTSNKSRHVNSGPSMFPFFPNPKAKPSNVIRTDKKLSGFQFPNCQQNQCTSFNNNFTWKPDATMAAGNSVKSCQYEDKTSPRVEQTTSLLGETEVILFDTPTDTADLPNYMTDKKTSTPTPAPVHSPIPAPTTATAPVTTPAPAPPSVPLSAPPSGPSFAPPSAPSSAPPTEPPSALSSALPSAPPSAFPSAPPSAAPSVPPSAPSRFSTHQIQANNDVGNTDAIKPNVIMCHNAEADLGFPGIFTITSSTTVPSSCDITYYRPAASSDLTHLISETRTQQALFPILRKFYSNAGSTMNREKDNLVTGTGTQISPEDSVDTVSMGVTTCNPALAERTTSYSNEAVYGLTQIERLDIAIQAEEFQPKPAEDTQMSPFIGVKDGVITSECLLIGNDAEKEHLPAQTGLAIQKLALTGTRIMSISSKELSNNKPSSKTEDKALGSTATVVLVSTAVGSNATMGLKALSNATLESKALSNVTASKSTSSSETVSSKCTCPGPEVGPMKVSCGTDPSLDVFNFTRSTSAKGLESFYETEILLNNLIKKALIGNTAGTLQAYSPDKVESSYKKSRSNMVYVTTSTNTDVGLETKSIGPTASDVTKLRDMNKTDAEIQYIVQEIAGPSSGRDEILSVLVLNAVTSDVATQTEGIDKFEMPTPHKSASMMTSYCGLTASIQFPAMSETAVESDASRNSVTPQYTCNDAGIDIETNTNYKRGPVTENLAQTSLVHTRQKSLEVKIFRNCPKKPLNSKTDLQNSVNTQLMSLSRLIGKKRTDSSIHSQMPGKWINEFPVEKSHHQMKFPNSHKSSSKNVFDAIVLTNEDNQIRKSCTFTLKADNHICTDDDNPVPYELPAIILSKDSLADVLPIIQSNEVYSKKSETQLALNPTMVDVVTSDNYVSKDVKESMLQACPEICETGTESLHPTCPKKSVCMLTTQCVLPLPPQCSGGQLYLPNSPDCVFVYGEPRCVVHKVCADAAIQLDHPPDNEVNVKRERVTHSVGQLTSHCSLRDGSQRNPSTLIREVLSPKVYKALYETTKLVVSKEMKQPSSKNSIAAHVDAAVDAAKFDLPQLKSAGMLTSEILMGSKSRCLCRERGSHAHCKRGLQHVKKSESDTHESHEDIDEECCEDCMRRQLVTSCRYYSNLLTKQLGRVKNNLARHLAPSMEHIEQPPQPNEACTMKPSGRNTLASQTLHHRQHGVHYNPIRPVSCCLLSPATSLTNICKYDKAHLKSVYYMLSAIEGRLRRLKLGSPSTYCQ